MPLIRVVYRNEDHDFDYVTCDRLDTLIMQDEITHFFRPSERKWVNIRLEPVRGSGESIKDPNAEERLIILNRLKEKDV